MSKPKPDLGEALAQHIVNQPFSAVQSALRILGWPLRFELVEVAEESAPATDGETVPRALFEETARRHKGAIARVDELLATIERVRALHQPQPDGTGFDDGQQCRTCSQDGGDGYQYLVPWPCPTVRALDEPPPAAIRATELETTARVLSALHQSAEDTVTRVIALHEQWVTAGPPPLGASLARWWDARLAEHHDAIQPKE
ncbi:hypothetical protein [Streptomyces tendae]|uniref:hypothetical protein n=1 Tax=Streptomyces tendae TaxID=1932 RepID=UPI0033D0088E